MTLSTFNVKCLRLKLKFRHLLYRFSIINQADHVPGRDVSELVNIRGAFSQPVCHCRCTKPCSLGLSPASPLLGGFSSTSCKECTSGCSVGSKANFCHWDMQSLCKAQSCKGTLHKANWGQWAASGFNLNAWRKQSWPYICSQVNLWMSSLISNLTVH